MKPFRQRIRTQTSPLAWLGRLVVVAFALALSWYGAMLVGLAIKASPATIDLISGYRTAYDFLAGLGSDDITGLVRVIVASAGVAAFLVFGFMAWKEIPRPYLARTDVVLSEDERTVVAVGPRAIERAAERAALGHPSISSASGRYGDDGINVDVHAARATGVADALRDVRRRVVEAAERHGLPALPVSVTLTGFDRLTGRELD